MSSPVTDGEQRSDELDEHETDASPQGLGYAPLDYQVLDGDDGEDFQNENENEAGEIDQDGASSQQPDVASAMLRAMEADYRACIESEARLAATETSVSNGPVTPTTAEATSEEASREEDVGPGSEANGGIISSSGQGQGESDGVGDGDDSGGGGGGLAPSAPAAEAPPPRPISPLGRDQAERVMRAMQGFSLAPPVPPPNGRTAADFEADWGSADALGATATATATNTNRGAEEGGREVLGQNGPSADQDQR